MTAYTGKPMGKDVHKKVSQYFRELGKKGRDAQKAKFATLDEYKKAMHKRFKNKRWAKNKAKRKKKL